MVILALGPVPGARAQAAATKPLTKIELSACITLNTLLDDMEGRISARNSELDRLRPQVETQADINRYNRLLYSNQNLEEIFNSYVDRYNRNCIANVNKSTVDEVCSYGNDRMKGFLDNGYGCDYWRGKFD